MNVLDAVIKGVLVGLFMAVSVGPTLFIIIKYSLNHSHKAGLAFVLGVSVSDIIYVTLANVAASWLRVLAPYERYIAIGGAIALMVIGLGSFFKKHKPKRPSSVPVEISGRDVFRIWLGGFLVNTLNPGVLITWLGAVTIIANRPAVYRFILFGVALVIILGFDFIKVFLADKIKRLLTIRRVIYMQRFSAACIFLIGVTLLITTIFSSHASGDKSENSINKILSQRIPVSRAPRHCEKTML